MAATLPANLGTAHARPRYNPHGAIQTAFLDGAKDAHNLGLQTLKIWNGPEVKSDPSFYFLSANERASLSDVSSALDLPSYKAVLAVPFKTVVFVVDDAVLWTMANTPLSQADKDRIYQSTHAFAVRLRKDFAGSGRTFVIQNHEGDWHIDPTGKPAAKNDPTPVGLNNFLEYWRIRQRAVADARASQPSDVKVYHLCEVVRVLPSLQSNAPSLTRDVLPQVACDLVGYSAYESALTSTSVFEQALAYIRTKALASPTFGTNQVAVSEIGIPEQDPTYSTARQQELASLIESLVRRGLPYVLFWTLYDNECNLPACAQSGGVTSNVPLANLRGFYVRRPDGSLGSVFKRVIDGLTTGGPSAASAAPTAAQEQLVRQAYCRVLSRAADAGGLSFHAGLLQAGTLNVKKLVRTLAESSEFRNQRIGGLAPKAAATLLYDALLARAPDAGGLTNAAAVLASGKDYTVVVKTLVESAEYTASFGDNRVPGDGRPGCSGQPPPANPPPANPPPGSNPPGSNPAPPPSAPIPAAVSAYLDKMYQQILKLAADAAGKAYWAGVYATSAPTCQGLTEAFLTDPAAKAAIYAPATDTAFLHNLYQALLWRPADAGGLNTWLGQLTGGTLSRAAVVQSFINSAEFASRCTSAGLTSR